MFPRPLPGTPHAAVPFAAPGIISTQPCCQRDLKVPTRALGQPTQGCALVPCSCHYRSHRAVILIRRGEPRCPKSHQLTAPLRASALGRMLLCCCPEPLQYHSLNLLVLLVLPTGLAGGAASDIRPVSQAELSQVQRAQFAASPGRTQKKNGKSTTAVSTPSHAQAGCVCGGVDGGRKAGADAAIGQGGLQIPREMNTMDRGLRRL